jgi:hypothetical protein
MKQVLRRFLVAISFVGAAAAQATEQADARWACWYQPSDLTVQCLLARADEGSEQRRVEVDRRFDRRLPELVRTIWAAPEQLAGARISIPLGSVPFEMEFVQQLARSVMCGVRRDCSVGFDANHDGRADVRAAAIEAGVSEQEVMAEVEAQGFRLADATPVEETAKKPRRRKALFG